MNITLESVFQTYGSVSALKAMSLSVTNSHCLALIGPSGGGKSTTLRLLAGLESPTSGSISINGKLLPRNEKRLHEYRKSVGVVFQAYNLFPHLNALENISLPLKVAGGYSKAKAEERAHELLTRFQLADHSGKRPAELSGGQNQRVAIARALGPDPSILLFDEPTSALDPEMTAEVLDVIDELIQEHKDVVIVTHEMGFARKMADQVAFIAEGCLDSLGPPESLFASPPTEKSVKFLSRVLKY